MLLNSSVRATSSPKSVPAPAAAALLSNLDKQSTSSFGNDSLLPDANNNTLSKARNNFPKSPATSKSQFSAKSVDDESYFVEDDQGDCVYVITYKKVYNKNMNSANSSPSVTPRPSYSQLSGLGTDESRVNPYGTYRLLTPLFCTYQDGQNGSGSQAASPGDGLVYSRVKIRQLKYATLAKFIENLTNEETGELDTNLVYAFLATYRTFTDTQTVLRLLKQRYEQILPASLEMTEDVRLESLRSIKLLLRLWLDNYGEDFAEPPDYPNLNELNRFAHSYLNDLELIKTIRAKFDQFESCAAAIAAAADNEMPSDGLSATLRHKLNMSDNDTVELPDPTALAHKRPSNSSTASNTHRRSFSNLAQSTSQSASHSSDLSLNSNQSKSQLNLDHALVSNASLLFATSSNLDETPNACANSLMSVDSRFIAEQLTYLDKCLFQHIFAYHCLASVWGTRYQKNAALAQNQSRHQKTNSSGSAAELTQSMSSSTTTPVLADKFATMRAFIDQFNRVSFVVQGTILEKTELRPVDRAKIINKWIEIALECRKLKNFSSLNAIVQGLNTQCVSRLVKTWNEVAPDLKVQFNHLTDMFSQDQNQKIFRDILMKDLNEYKELYGSNDNLFGLSKKMSPKNENNYRLNQSSSEVTVKYADIESGLNATLSRKMKEKMLKRSNESRLIKEPIGTIPFLGTFLKDLEYINAQNSQKNEKGLINVMQKRKEFEIIAQIKLLQQASHLYSIKHDENFQRWLSSLPIYSEVQNYNLSYLIEPKFERDLSSNSSSLKDRKVKNGLSQGSRSESVESISSSNPPTNGSHSKTPSSVSRNIFKLNSVGSNATSSGAGILNQQHSRNSSMGSASDVAAGETPIGGGGGLNNQRSLIDSTPSDNQSTNTSAASVDAAFYPKYGTMGNNKPDASSASEVRVKVNMDTKEHSNVMYKKMSINDKYRTRDVKRLILEKFFLNADTCDKYTLVQILGPGNELVINDNCNVFYAAKTVPDMQFVLRSKSVTPTLSFGSSLSSADPAVTANGATYGAGNLKNQAKFSRHSSVNLNYNSSYLHQLPPQSNGKSSKWWLKKILS